MGGACRRERQRAGAERVEGVASKAACGRTLGEWDPRQEGATNSFFVRRETGTIRVTHLETATRAPCSVTLTMTVYPVAIHSRRRVDTDVVRLPACAIQAPELHGPQPHRPLHVGRLASHSSYDDLDSGSTRGAVLVLGDYMCASPASFP